MATRATSLVIHLFLQSKPVNYDYPTKDMTIRIELHIHVRLLLLLWTLNYKVCRSILPIITEFT